MSVQSHRYFYPSICRGAVGYISKANRIINFMIFLTPRPSFPMAVVLYTVRGNKMRFWLFCIAMIMYQNIACAATCGAGNYYNTSKYRCTLCNEGYYCPGDDTEHPCPSGTYNNKTGTSSSDDCKFPAAGYIATDCKKWGWSANYSYTLITFISEGCTDYERCPEGAY